MHNIKVHLISSSSLIISFMLFRVINPFDNRLLYRHIRVDARCALVLFTQLPIMREALRTSSRRGRLIKSHRSEEYSRTHGNHDGDH